MAIGFDFAARSDIGLGRYKNNQDSGYAGPHLLVVADGMGGAAGGDVASSTVVATLAPLDNRDAGSEPLRDLASAVADANTAMRTRVRADGSLDGMGSTCTTLRLVGSQLILAHVGDSRAYVLADGMLRQVTHDHTFVQRLVDTGQITEAEAERHPQRSVILRVVGHLDDDNDVDTASFEAASGQRWLLCSDGLPRVISADTIHETLAQHATPAEAAERLIELALRAGGPDNITVIVADVVDSGAHLTPNSPHIVGAAALATGAEAVSGEHAASSGHAQPASDRSADEESTDHDHTDQDPAGPATTPGAGPEDDEQHRPRWITNALVALVLLAVLAASLVGLRTWFRTQYYVGTDGGNVAIFRGWNESLGPLNQPTLHQRTALPVATLPAVNRDRLGDGGMDPGSLPSAELTVRQLWKSSSLCTDTTSARAPGAAEPGATTGPGALVPTPGVPGVPEATVPITPGDTSGTDANDATANDTADTTDTAAQPPRPVECDQ